MQIVKQIFFLLFASMMFTGISSAKTPALDSLQHALKNAETDSIRAEVIYNIARYYDVAGNYNESIKQFNNLLAAFKKINNKHGMAEAYNNIGLIYEKQGNYAKAVEVFFNSLKMWEEIGDKYNVISGYINIALLYGDLGNYELALTNAEKALSTSKKLKDKRYLGYCYNTLGITYFYKGDTKKTLESHLAALKLREDVGDTPEIGATLNNLGITYAKLGDEAEANNDKKTRDEYYAKAMQHYKACIKIAIKNEDKASVAMCELNTGVLNTMLKNYTEAKKQIESALSVFIEIGSKEGMKETYKARYDLDSISGNEKGAYINYINYIAYRDSLLNDDNTRKATQVQMQYDFDKKESIQKAEQDKIDALRAEEIRVQKTIRNAFTIGFTLVLILVIVVFKSYREKRIANDLLAERNRLIETQKIEVEQKNEELNQQNEEISTQRDELEKQKLLVDQAYEKLHEKNKEVMDSIMYARRIQRALLTPEKYIERELNKLMKKG